MKLYFRFRCEIPCERDCQIGQWSEWSPCMPSKCTAEVNNEPRDGKILIIIITFCEILL